MFSSLTRFSVGHKNSKTGGEFLLSITTFSIKTLEMQSTIYINMRKVFITTQQSILEGSIGKLGFRVGRNQVLKPLTIYRDPLGSWGLGWG